MIDLSIKGKNIKSIGAKEEGFESIYPVNIIIGRNNAGKSTLLDIVQAMLAPDTISLNGHKGSHPEILLTKPLSKEEIQGAFPNNTSEGPIPGNHLVFGMRWLNKPITIRITPNKEFVSTDPPLEQGIAYSAALARVFQNYFSGKLFRRIRADRDIVQEQHGGINIKDNGQGITNIIQTFYNQEDKERTLVTEKLLTELNKIFNPDVNFSEIVVRRKTNSDFYEVYLREENKGLIALSASGSGLKTVIMVLSNLLLIPNHENQPLSKYVFAFEELENNLHPGLQRRLFNYIREIAVKEGAYFFITTHSNVVIDLFNKDEESQIIHVTHNGDISSVKKVVTYIENRGILDDLDIRASDLLQSNGVVWLEGPSDRLYFNRWIDLWSNGELKEGTHYQCVFYGGRLLAHLSALEEEAGEEHGVNILKVNKNAILLLDSDRANATTPLNATKNRIIKEIATIEGYSWVTAGREIENYVPAESLNKAFGVTTFTQISDFDKFEEYLNSIKEDEGDKFLRNKVLYSEKILPNLTKENLEPILDIKERLDAVYKTIKSWNSI